MTTMTTVADKGADERRKNDRRVRNAAFEGRDRRVAQRRAARDRRAGAA